LGRLVSRDWDRGRIIIRTCDVGANGFADLSERIQSRIDQLFGPLDVRASLTGTPYTAYRGINSVTTDLRNSLLLAFFIIAVILVFVLRDLRVAALCFLPNAFPLIIGYGLMGLVGWELEPTSGLVFTLALAIAVDDTIHLIARWREELRSGYSMEDAIRRAVLFTGRAVTITSVVLCGGFLINVLGSFPSMQVLGYLGACVILSAMLADLFVLPALLQLFAVRPPKASPASDPRVAG
jgi:predicted RND superfamily exporter protein